MLSPTSNSNSSTGDFIELKFWLYSQLTSEAIVLENLSIVAAGNTEQAISVAVWKSQNAETVLDGGGSDEPAKIYSLYPDYGFEFTLGMTGYSATAALNTVETPATLLALHSTYYESGATPATNIVTDTLTSATTITTLTADTQSLIVVRIWIEGWDAQTVNDILASTFDISFVFGLRIPS